MTTPDVVDQLTIRCQDESVVSMPKDLLMRYSVTVRDLLSKGGATDMEGVVPLEVTAKTMERIKEFLELHKDDGPPDVSLLNDPKKLEAPNTAVDANWLQSVSMEEVRDLILAADRLLMDQLSNVVLKQAVSSLVGNSADQLKQLWDLQSDFSDEQNAKWVEGAWSDA